MEGLGLDPVARRVNCSLYFNFGT
jgi:uncharacterized protein YjbI with pentapeptide repeats